MWTFPHPSSGCTTISLRSLNPSKSKIVAEEPSRFDTEMRESALSVQYSFLVTQSTARPEGLSTSPLMSSFWRLPWRVESKWWWYTYKWMNDTWITTLLENHYCAMMSWLHHHYITYEAYSYMRWANCPTNTVCPENRINVTIPSHGTDRAEATNG